LPPRDEVKDAYSTHQKSIDLLDYKHNTNLEAGVLSMWKWAIKQPKRLRRSWDLYEIDKGLYPYWQPEALKDGYYKKEEK